ncbi:hypothetical protein FPV67DRAFT_1454144 [Lyophyllum atratum]|nr:hypothetical protein FPV67DRAFT_1454144 [Lyophyllum atratum]
MPKSDGLTKNQRFVWDFLQRQENWKVPGCPQGRRHWREVTLGRDCAEHFGNRSYYCQSCGRHQALPLSPALRALVRERYQLYLAGEQSRTKPSTRASGTTGSAPFTPQTTDDGTHSSGSRNPALTSGTSIYSRQLALDSRDYLTPALTSGTSISPASVNSQAVTGSPSRISKKKQAGPLSLVGARLGVRDLSESDSESDMPSPRSLAVQLWGSSPNPKKETVPIWIFTKVGGALEHKTELGVAGSYSFFYDREFRALTSFPEASISIYDKYKEGFVDLPTQMCIDLPFPYPIVVRQKTLSNSDCTNLRQILGNCPLAEDSYIRRSKKRASRSSPSDSEEIEVGPVKRRRSDGTWAEVIELLEEEGEHISGSLDELD